MSGLQNIKKKTKEKDKARIYYHMDLDGVASAAAMIAYLRRYNVQITGYSPIQYGEIEYAVDMRSDNDTLHVLVDFAHGKPQFDIHTDHHQSQAGVNLGAANHFRPAASNAETINLHVSPSLLFKHLDSECVSIIDSAKFHENGIKAADTRNVLFSPDKSIEYKSNFQNLSLATNKIILSYRNKPGFLDYIVKNSTPSILNIYLNCLRWIRENDVDDLNKINDNCEKYVDRMKEYKNLEVDNNIAIQYGGGKMFDTGSYNRYTVFENNPDIHYFIMIWPMGLVQASKNPFTNIKDDVDFGKIKDEILEEDKVLLERFTLNLYELKKFYENNKKVQEYSIGFTYNDVLAFYRGKILSKLTEKPLRLGSHNKPDRILKDILSPEVKFESLKESQVKFLKGFTINAYEIIAVNSGGHKSITNISNINILNYRLHTLKKHSKHTSVKSYMMDVAERIKKKLMSDI